MVKESELATEAEILEALDSIQRERDDEARKNLADKASAEIMAAHEGKLLTDQHGQPILPSGWFRFPDPPPDALVLALAEALEPLQDRLRSVNTHDRDAFGREIVERLADAGVLARTIWHHSAVPGVYIPEVEPLGVNDRWTWTVVDHPDYDPDHQVHDVVNDLLETGERGTIGGNFNPFDR